MTRVRSAAHPGIAKAEALGLGALASPQAAGLPGAWRIWAEHSAAGSPDPDDATAADHAVMGGEGQAVGQAGGHDQSVGRIAREAIRELIEADDDLHIERQDLNHRGRCGSAQPAREGPIQNEPSLGLQHLGLPEAHRRKTDAAGGSKAIQGVRLAGAESLTAQ